MGAVRPSHTEQNCDLPVCRVPQPPHHRDSFRTGLGGRSAVGPTTTTFACRKSADMQGIRPALSQGEGGPWGASGETLRAPFVRNVKPSEVPLWVVPVSNPLVISTRTTSVTAEHGHDH